MNEPKGYPMPNNSKAVKTADRKVIKVFLRPEDYAMIEGVCDSLDLLPGQFVRQAALERVRFMKALGASLELVELAKSLGADS